MDTYINKEETIERINRLFTKNHDGSVAKNDYNSGLYAAKAEIVFITAADVQLMKRGNWVQIGEQSAKCTECGGVLKSNGIDKTGKALIFNAVYHYCPYCGARMIKDGEIDE